MTELSSTYRIQFHKGFTFSDFEKALNYLQALGIDTIYASPVFEATPGSMHGYDTLDPHNINPGTGTVDQLKMISKKLQQHGIKWLQDIVPNHMAFDTRNAWIMDVLEKGRQSLYYDFFDIIESEGKLMVPFLGQKPGKAIDDNELNILFDGHRFVFRYFDARYPLNVHSYRRILEPILHIDAVKELWLQLDDMIHVEDAGIFHEQLHEWQMQLSGLYKNALLRKELNAIIANINENKNEIRQIVKEQFYRLCHWRETDERINYRRFFTVNGLICLNMQERKVFDQFHLFIKELVDENVFTGLRIDHIDGLYNPAEYLERLRKLVGENIPVYVEKILARGENLPGNWLVEGTTGYDFLAFVNNLFTNIEAEAAFTDFYNTLVNDRPGISEQVREKKSLILHRHMAGELENLVKLFSETVSPAFYGGIPFERIKETIAQFLIYMPVYRFYDEQLTEDATLLKTVFSQVKISFPVLKEGAEMLENYFALADITDEEEKQKRWHFYKRCMQFSGPLMAKGVEDTLMYTYNRFVAHNEVGDSPASFGMPVKDFHRQMHERLISWPHTMNATSTHDTKRGEDQRARLQVLTDMDTEWFYFVHVWMEMNKDLKVNSIPSVNEEYFIYQAMVGTYPNEGICEEYKMRLTAYVEKSLREGKEHSNWSDPAIEYEQETKQFVLRILDNETFIKSIADLYAIINDHGILNSLGQLVLKFTCPGVPDIYQGCELWDFNFVDPDNRRPVDYPLRDKMLQEISETKNGAAFFYELWQSRNTGKIKLWLTQKLLQIRKENDDLFRFGDYIPLTVKGHYKDHILAFGRKWKGKMLVTLLPLHMTVICKEQQEPWNNIDWKETTVDLPEGIEMKNILTGKNSRSNALSQVFTDLPLAILSYDIKENVRSAGVLCHFTSLPGDYGLGDLGPAAKKFATQLQQAGQRYWQLLPVNPVAQEQGYSPYSSTSAFAGNILLVSPELLVRDGLLQPADLQEKKMPSFNVISFAEAEKTRNSLLEKAWLNFNQGNRVFENAFYAFCEEQKYWLDDFACFSVLKEKFNGRPWYTWPQLYKNYDAAVLAEFSSANETGITKIKWFQFVFQLQWNELSDFCHRLDIQLVGDIPFYVAYDSADAWSHRDIFSINDNGEVTAMAGVPPDAFSENGQLWGMPVYKWNDLKRSGYSWWIERLRRNLRLFDLVRLDHFRAFAAWWEVPAASPTAKHGKWITGPGADFFKTVKNKLGALPFIAEDLGDIDAKVHELRDAFHLPGMKVLQFAFGDDAVSSGHIPHNYEKNFFVYTGTHDNNTTRGWFTKELDGNSMDILQSYFIHLTSEENIVSTLSRLAYSSVAQTVILPIQDILNLNETARMNTPASAGENWTWRMLPGEFNKDRIRELRRLTNLYNRG
jgi:malto-oligosyltrehalose synthase/4-alpha-glucanotransferase